jgi:hypothetical protein
MNQTLIFSLLTACILAAAATSVPAQTTDSGGLLRVRAGKTPST